ncbi:MAG: helix-turn-helix domain-containing protein [Pseudomonadota bacterium]|nr:helix-turn-helix domain-containing protein [Pseudomonadota bacterium]
MADWQEQTYYQILEVTKEAGEHEVHEAYLRAKATYSTESPALYTMFTPTEAQQLNRLIEEAYAVLGNQRLRSAYNEKLKSETPANSGETRVSINLRKPSGDIASEEGLGRTKFGTYKISSAMEDEINAQTVWDGSFLKKVRQYKEIPVESIAETTRIGLSYLVAMERNDFTAIPAPVFVRGFLVQLCKILNLDERRVTKSYLDLYKNALGKK